MQYEFDGYGYKPMFAISPEKTIKFTVMGEPMSKSRPRFNPKTGRAYTPERTREAERAVRDAYEANAGDYQFLNGVGIELRFFLGTRRVKDTDNLTKLVKDALNNVAYPDDAAVSVEGAVRYFTTRERARTEVLLFHVPELVEP